VWETQHQQILKGFAHVLYSVVGNIVRAIGRDAMTIEKSQVREKDLVEYLFENGVQDRLESHQAQSLMRVVEDIPLSGISDNSILFIASNNVAYLTHGLHDFPAKFIPQIPRWAMRKYTKEKDIVLDPMCGSGTTLVEARLHGRNSYGIDIEPLAQFLTKAKTTPLDAKRLVSDYDWLLRQISSDDRKNLDLPDFPNRDHWFRKEVLADLAIIKRNILQIDDGNVRRFFLACFSSIIKKTSNADPEFVYALAYSKRMKQLDQSGRKIKAISEFRHTCDKALPEMVKFSRKSHKDVFSRIIGQDAREIELEDSSVDLAITSPPYINAVDYVRAHKLEMYWLDLLKDGTLELQRRFIGTERVSAREYSGLQSYGNDKLDKLLCRIYQIDRRRSYVVFKFFVDMKSNFEEVYRVLKKGKHYTVVSGDGVIRGIPIPTHEIIIDVAKDAGFSLVNCFSYVIRSRHMKIPRQGIGGLIKADWITTFKK